MQKKAVDYSDRFLVELRSAIRSRLASLGMTQVELAERLGVSQATIGKLLSDRTGMTLSTALRLCRAVGLSLTLGSKHARGPTKTGKAKATRA